MRFIRSRIQLSSPELPVVIYVGVYIIPSYPSECAIADYSTASHIEITIPYVNFAICLGRDVRNVRQKSHYRCGNQDILMSCLCHTSGMLQILSHMAMQLGQSCTLEVVIWYHGSDIMKKIVEITLILPSPLLEDIVENRCIPIIVALGFLGKCYYSAGPSNAALERCGRIFF